LRRQFELQILDCPRSHWRPRSARDDKQKVR
jgi:hypothetical protein